MAAAHWVIFNAKGKPSGCVKGAKVEKARKETENLSGFTMREVKPETCPFCNPPKVKEPGKPVLPVATDDDRNKPGRCHSCAGWRFHLIFVNHVMVRECQDCGVWFDIDKLCEWES